jgi:N-acylglucosamine-6-phosphate 2-epimerase
MNGKQVKPLNHFKPKSLIVSCQALPDEPLYGSHIMSKMALAAYLGGATGIRANGYEDIKAIKETVDLPVIGIVKQDYPDSPVYITPTLKEVRDVVRAGAEIVAIDATHRHRPNGESLEALVQSIRREFPELILMADIATKADGLKAEALGFDMISTTLTGYTEETKGTPLPNYRLVKDLLKHTTCPIIAEGGIQCPNHLAKLFKLGVYGAVIGSAITRPQLITQSFAKVIDHV